MEPDPVAVVAAQVDAYNSRDLDRFLDCYSPDAIIEDASGQVLMRGRDAMRGVYEKLFTQSLQLHCEIRHRIHVGRYVIDEEAITGFQYAGYPTEVHAAAVYRVEGGRIVYVRGFMPESESAIA
ncbi:MAG: nuclear transport factor 2 family protein [Acidobacteriota bacterium]